MSDHEYISTARAQVRRRAFGLVECARCGRFVRRLDMRRLWCEDCNAVQVFKQPKTTDDDFAFLGEMGRKVERMEEEMDRFYRDLDLEF